MQNCQDLNWGKEILSKLTPFGVSPSKTILMFHHLMMEQIPFFWPKEIIVVNLVDNLLPLFRVTARRPEARR